ncbi:M23 family metallopeptidase [Larkinella insperata]|uniref:M23 family metallopeptidase n=1 Tax=Larkinella insperata TaxID=332158 RepID=A0ABW3Q553_9BACT
MNTLIRFVGFLTAKLLLIPGLSLAQTSPGTDSVRAAWDSLEVSLLKTTRTYAQVDRLIQAINLRPEYLDRLPSTFPVAVTIKEFSISSPFGLRKHPVHKQTRFHGGIDVRAKKGLPVTATAPGIVKRVGYDPGLGAFVQVLHSFGFETVYGHLAGYCVQPGQRIIRGQEIGKVGQTGLATGPHLHYVVRKNGEPIDPLHFCFLLRRRLWLLK